MLPPQGKRPSFLEQFGPDIAGAGPAPEAEATAEPDKTCPCCGASCAKIEAAAGAQAPVGGEMPPLA